jgi:superoxide dismutase
MTKAEEILEKHLAIMDAETMIGKHGRTHKAVINAINEAINYTHSCTELKDKEKISFVELLRVEDINMHQDGTFYISSERSYVELTFLINRYNSLNL